MNAPFASGGVIASINPNQFATLDYKKLTFSTGGTVDCTIMFE